MDRDSVWYQRALAGLYYSQEPFKRLESQDGRQRLLCASLPSEYIIVEEPYLQDSRYWVAQLYDNSNGLCRFLVLQQLLPWDEPSIAFHGNPETGEDGLDIFLEWGGEPVPLDIVRLDKVQKDVRIDEGWIGRSAVFRGHGFFKDYQDVAQTFYLRDLYSQVKTGNLYAKYCFSDREMGVNFFRGALRAFSGYEIMRPEPFEDEDKEGIRRGLASVLCKHLERGDRISWENYQYRIGESIFWGKTVVDDYCDIFLPTVVIEGGETYDTRAWLERQGVIEGGQDASLRLSFFYEFNYRNLGRVFTSAGGGCAIVSGEARDGRYQLRYVTTSDTEIMLSEFEGQARVDIGLPIDRALPARCHYQEFMNNIPKLAEECGGECICDEISEPCEEYRPRSVQIKATKRHEVEL